MAAGSPGATLSFHADIGCHCLPSLRDLHSSPAAITAIVCRNDKCHPAPLQVVFGEEGGPEFLDRAGKAEPRASLPLTPAAHLNVRNNSFDRVYL